jgi:hypothetical protein
MTRMSISRVMSPYPDLKDKVGQCERGRLWRLATWTPMILLYHDTTIYLGARTPNRQFEGQLDRKFSAGEYYEMSS